jgi:hypothetical protein
VFATGEECFQVTFEWALNGCLRSNRSGNGVVLISITEQ